jgi:sugar/nucleoside kinase (ribokinase family)
MELAVLGNVGFTQSTVGDKLGPWTIGGAAYGFALGAASAGVFPAIYSLVGGDFPNKVLDTIATRVDITNIVKDNLRKTGMFRYKYRNPDVRPSVKCDYGVLVDMQKYASFAKTECKWLHLCATLPLLNIDALPIRLKVQCVSMSFIRSSIQKIISSSRLSLTQSKLVFLNSSEWDALRGSYTWVRKAPSTFIVTDKTNVRAIQSHNEVLRARVDLTPFVLDTTGAGDVFAGAVVARIMQGDTLLDAMKCAIVTAQLVVHNWGLRSLEQQLFGQYFRLQKCFTSNCID